MDTPTPSPSLGIAGRMAAAFQSNAITPLLALVALLLGVVVIAAVPGFSTFAL